MTASTQLLAMFEQKLVSGDDSWQCERDETPPPLTTTPPDSPLEKPQTIEEVLADDDGEDTSVHGGPPMLQQSSPVMQPFPHPQLMVMPVMYPQATAQLYWNNSIQALFRMLCGKNDAPVDLSFLSDDFMIATPTISADASCKVGFAGTFRGKEGIEDFSAKLRKHTVRYFEPMDIATAGTVAFTNVKIELVIKGTGKMYQSSDPAVITFNGGKIAALNIHIAGPQLLKAFEPPPPAPIKAPPQPIQIPLQAPPMEGAPAPFAFPPSQPSTPQPPQNQQQAIYIPLAVSQQRRTTAPAPQIPTTTPSTPSGRTISVSTPKAQQSPSSGRTPSNRSQNRLVAVEPACGHNSWDNVRIKKGEVTYRCRICQAQWRTDVTNAGNARCTTFSQQGSCPNNPCADLHVHPYKQSLSQRIEQFGGSVLDRVPWHQRMESRVDFETILNKKEPGQDS